MAALSAISDGELLARLPALVQTERHAMAEVIEHLVEVERRRLYLKHTSSLYRYCIDWLGYSDEAALKRHRVARLALRLPQVIDELRAGSIRLTALFLLAKYLTEGNATALLIEARGKSRRQIEELIARWFPRPDVASSVSPVLGRADATCPGDPGAGGAGNLERSGRLEPLSIGRVRVEFTARSQLGVKLERARDLLSRSLARQDLGELFERALDVLIEKEERRQLGAGRPRKQLQLKPGSRCVPVAVRRAVWQRDGGQCTFVDAESQRCPERRFLEFEHRQPHAQGGAPTVDNVCLLCRAHNLASARAVFGDQHVDAKIRESQVLAALCRLGFRRGDAEAAIRGIAGGEPRGAEGSSAHDVSTVEQLLRESLALLVAGAA